MRSISAEALHEALSDGREIAILDAREEGEFGHSHLFWASPCPLSKVELVAPRLVPCRAVRIVCVDDGRGLANSLAEWLAAQGYDDVRVLDGGNAAWQAAGFELFSGVHVPSKAFGEWVEHHYGTESVDAAELDELRKAHRDMVVLDSRTFEEFNQRSIPGGISVPGGELAYRIRDIAPRPDTLVVVNCAGRTRSIMGAESLRRIGIPNKVVALRNGTMGWHLAGLSCEYGSGSRFEPSLPREISQAARRADEFARDAGVRFVSMEDLDRFRADLSKTLYLLDVRDPREFSAGTLAGAINAPGGQLIQATDQWIAVQGARIVLVDDTGVRARMSAGWLRQMGHQNVFVLEPGIDASRMAVSPVSKAPETGMSPRELQRRLQAGEHIVILDLARSIDFREAHIEGAIWGVRTRLGRLAPQFSNAGLVVVMAPDSRLAHLACAEIRGLGASHVDTLTGGLKAWAAEGYAVVADRAVPSDEDCIDFYLRPYDRNSGVEDAMHAYLSWEINLIEQLQLDRTVRFGASGPAEVEPHQG